MTTFTTLARIGLLALLVLALAPRAVSTSSAQLAARTGDFQSCPLSTNGVPHGGGVVVGSANTVLICGSTAATVGDLGQCNGPDTSIASGSNTVFIEGRPAARTGSVTTHGGSVVTGCATVNIGG